MPILCSMKYISAQGFSQGKNDWSEPLLCIIYISLCKGNRYYARITQAAAEKITTIHSARCGIAIPKIGGAIPRWVFFIHRARFSYILIFFPQLKVIPYRTFLASAPQSPFSPMRAARFLYYLSTGIPKLKRLLPDGRARVLEGSAEIERTLWYSYAAG